VFGSSTSPDAEPPEASTTKFGNGGEIADQSVAADKSTAGTRKPLGQHGSAGYPSQPENSSLVGASQVAGDPEVTASDAAALAQASAAEVLACDFSLTVIEVLRLLVEVLSPASVQQLCWAVRGKESAQDGCVAVLDFVETEMAFCEFQRFLLRVSEQKTLEIDAQQLSMSQRLEGFLKHVFLPALDDRYKGPKLIPPEEETEDAEPASAVAEDADIVTESPIAPEEGKEEAESPDNVPQADKPSSLESRLFDLWQGFEGTDLHAQEELYALRAWPAGYEKAVLSWQ
jgi:hypothetical protein